MSARAFILGTLLSQWDTGFSLFSSRDIQVSVNRHAIAVFEKLYQVVFVKVEAAGQVIQADTPLEVFVKVILDRLDIKCIIANVNVAICFFPFS